MAAQSEPPRIRALLTRFAPYCAGLSLCGAGAGGFGAFLLQEEAAVQTMRDMVEDINAATGGQLSLQHVEVDTVGVHVNVIMNDVAGTQTSPDLKPFLQWLANGNDKSTE
jgi:hypothetical protein